ncbi:DNA-directed DNA polymerase [Metamycoplasma cloacale]|uniref:DNA polymerase III subunit gamma/tau n=2 Tax=Metamycoplasma cloacale TaxID=92401 RepID=A0A2Z4LME8_9BACT|nr:DNA polymerase III subunit gamma/tau [Metamycoplasma cloacale]AWX42916.1 DNA polymerase III subunit gamma/tau [Metamycoplasma cloacale]VEU79259.1 DNA-directed DNA polymerase [Metamycoplasma cloacale]
MENKYLTLYRQFRPNSFDEVKGQKNIITTLKNIILTNKISHAYLFCGPHGTGKTSVAKIFANTINCRHSSDKLKPCLECIENIDRNLDIIEIDAASNTGIDDIRELREKIKHVPTHSNYKIYIIDEVHMLSKGAFNALLKTLEEPPQHAIFILATTDPQKIPFTILSRVQRFNFQKINLNEIIDHLKYIFDKENIQYQNNVLTTIAKLGKGSLRDTLSIADQISVYVGNGVISNESIEELFGLANKEYAIDILNLLYSKNTKAVLQNLHKLIEQGINLEKLLVQLIDILRDYIIYIKTKSGDLLELIELEDINKLNLTTEIAYIYVEEINKTIKELKYSDYIIQNVELLFLKLTHVKNIEDNQNVKVLPKTDTIEIPQNLIQTNQHSTNQAFFEKTTDIDEMVNLDAESNHFDQDFENTTDFVVNEKVVNKTIADNKGNTFLNLSDIQTKTHTTEIDIDTILERTSEIMVNENTKLMDQNDLNNSIISSSFDNTDENEINDFQENNQLFEKQDSLISDIDNKIKTQTMEFKQREFIDQETLIECLIINMNQKKNVLQKLPNVVDYAGMDATNFSQLETKLKKQKDIELINLIKDMKLKASAKDFVIFVGNNTLNVITLNKKAYEHSIVCSAAHLFGRFVHIMAITDKQYEDIKKYWKDHIDEIRTRKPKITFQDLAKKYDKELKKLEEAGREIFGDDFMVK